MPTRGTQQRGVRVDDALWGRFVETVRAKEAGGVTASDVLRTFIALYVEGELTLTRVAGGTPLTRAHALPNRVSAKTPEALRGLAQERYGWDDYCDTCGVLARVCGHRTPETREW